MKKQRKNKGFTIVELIVVMAIIAVLILIAVPTFTKYLEDANQTSELGTASSIYKSAITTITSESLNGPVDTAVDSSDTSDVTLATLEAEVVAGVSNSISANELSVGIYTSGTPTVSLGSATEWVVLYPATGTVIDATGDIYIISPNATEADRKVYRNGALN